MILALLKQRTTPVHKRLEHGLGLDRNLHTLADYRRLLCGFYGLYAPLEIALEAVFEAHPLPLDFAARRKVPWLERDLHALGLSAPELRAIPHCPTLPALGNLAAALGCLYVLEGATLGGQVIARYVAQTWGLTPAHGSAFFHSYGARVGECWRAFGAVLSAYAAGAPQEHILGAAYATFIAFERWLLRDTRREIVP